MSKRDVNEIMDGVLNDGSDSEDETTAPPSPKRQALADATEAAPTGVTSDPAVVVKQKQKSQKRQKGEPKGKMTAYGFFSNEIRTHMKESNQIVAFTELSKQTAQLWRGMTEEQKAPYEQQAREDKERWTKEMEVFKAGLPFGPPANANADGTSSVEKIVKPNSATPGDSTKKQKVKVKKDKNAPKGPVGSFLFFYADVRAELVQSSPEMENTEMGKVAGMRWKALTPEEKAPYELKAKEDKERHTREMAKYIATNPQAAQAAPSGNSGNSSSSTSAFSKSSKSTPSTLWGIRRQIESRVSKWDEKQFENCDDNEREQRKSRVSRECRQNDVKNGMHDMIIYKSRESALKVLDAALKAAIQTLTKKYEEEDDDSDSDDEGPENRKKLPPTTIEKSENLNKFTATVHRYVDPYHNQLKTVGQSTITFELLQFTVKE
jgi:hypothetical protein